MPPAQEASYLKTLLRPGTHGLDLNLRWDWWSIMKRTIRNRSVLPWRDREYYEEALKLAANPSDQPDLEGYKRLFAPAHGKLTGDIAPIYSSLSVDQIRAYRSVLEPARIFMIARDPVQRFWSAMSRHALYGTFGNVDYSSLSAAQRLFEDRERSLQHHPTQILDRWDSVLGAGSVKVFYFDDLASRPDETLRDILSYVGSDYRYRFRVVPPKFNRKGRQRRVVPSPEAAEWVRAVFQDELLRCGDRFGEHGKAWLERNRDGAEAVPSSSAVTREAR